MFLARRITGNRIVIFAFVYSLFILYETLLSRSIGTAHKVELMLFWSYMRFDSASIRYEVYLNIFLFIPFGFLLALTRKWNMKNVLLTSCFFSVFIEVIQYIGCLGLCEIDDVFHNTLGSAVGYWYWKSLEFISQKFPSRNHSNISNTLFGSGETNLVVSGDNDQK